jgi:hypothetical protein
MTGLIFAVLFGLNFLLFSPCEGKDYIKLGRRVIVSCHRSLTYAQAPMQLNIENIGYN